jgi:hypothetical protein
LNEPYEVVARISGVYDTLRDNRLTVPPKFVGRPWTAVEIDADNELAGEECPRVVSGIVGIVERDAVSLHALEATK